MKKRMYNKISWMLMAAMLFSLQGGAAPVLAQEVSQDEVIESPVEEVSSGEVIESPVEEVSSDEVIESPVEEVSQDEVIESQIEEVSEDEAAGEAAQEMPETEAPAAAQTLSDEPSVDGIAEEGNYPVVESGKTYIKKQKVDITPFFADTPGISYYRIIKKEQKYATVTKSTGVLKGIKKGSVTVLGVDESKNILKGVRFDVAAPKLSFTEPCYDLNTTVDAKAALTDLSDTPKEWSTTTPKLCSVDPETGTVTPIKRGDAIVVAHYTQGLNTVKIKGKLKISVPVISAKKVSLPLNKTKKLILKKIPDKSYPVEWKSLDEQVATVDADGRVRPVAKGITSVNAVYRGMTFSCEVTVKAATHQKSGTFKIDLGNGRSATVTGHYDTAFSNELFRLVNEYRKQNGLNALKKDDELENAGYLRARETAYLFSHTRPNGERCFTAFPKQDCICMGENIAAGQPTAQEMFNSWKNSEGHNRNMLNPDFTHASMMVFVLESEPQEGYNYVYYGVQCFEGKR